MRLSLFLTKWVGVFAVLFTLAAQAGTENKTGYYGAEFIQGYQNNTLKNQALLQNLFLVLSGGHVHNANGIDTITSSCTGLAQSAAGTGCTQHTALGYDQARKIMFGKMYLEQVGGVYAVKDVYCEQTFTDHDFNDKPSIGPGLIPTDGSVLNTEHTWPQSRFTSRFPKETQKSDLHHLFPSDSKMNSHRGNLRFGFVVEEIEKLKCPMGRLGHQAEGGIIFEAPMNHRGNVARAIFYFATRYQMKVSPPEEAALRQWNKQDPIDEAEMRHNDEIAKAQGNRNPYIDFPDLLSRIDHFNQ